jgi:hypothetical protein
VEDNVPKYDAAIVGAGFAGLSVAALLSKAGMKVVLTDPSDRAGGAVAAFEKDGFHFAAGPNATYGLDQGGTLNTFCTALDMAGFMARSPARYQVVLPDRRITVMPSQQDTLEELRREFPREIDQIAAMYRDAAKTAQKSASNRIFSYLTSWRSAKAFLRQYRFTPELTAYIEVQAHYFFGQGIETLPLSSLTLMLCTAPDEFPEGFPHLIAQIATRVIDRKGTVLWKEPWPKLQHRGRRASGIRTSQGDMEARWVIVNADWGPWEQTLFLGIHEEVLPVSMENTVLCLSDYRKPQEYLSLAIAPRGMNAPANMRALSASFPVQGTASADARTLMERLQAIMPFLKDFVVTVDDKDGHARRFVLSDPITPRSHGPHAQPPLQLRGNLKNVVLMPDSSRLLLPSVRNAQMTAARLT